MGLGRLTTWALWLTILLCLGAITMQVSAAGFKALSKETMVLGLPVFAALMGHRGRRFPRLALLVSVTACGLGALGLFAVLSKTSPGLF